MSWEGSVTRWMGQLQAGDPEAARPLWQRYYPRLVALARAKMRGVPGRSADEEDIALSAFDSFCRAAGNGRFPNLPDRDSLWHLLLAMTARKACDWLRYEGAQKRNGGTLDEAAALEEVVGKEPTPEFAAQVAEECGRLLRLLDDAELQSLAMLKMAGYTNQEIADRLGYVRRTVERKLDLIRQIWEKEVRP